MLGLIELDGTFDRFGGIECHQPAQHEAPGRGGLHGVICGHTHHAEIRNLGDGITYYNCGDWVDSCTALAEDFEGNIHLIRPEHTSVQVIAEKPADESSDSRAAA